MNSANKVLNIDKIQMYESPEVRWSGMTMDDQTNLIILIKLKGISP